MPEEEAHSSLGTSDGEFKKHRAHISWTKAKLRNLTYLLI